MKPDDEKIAKIAFITDLINNALDAWDKLHDEAEEALSSEISTPSQQQGISSDPTRQD